MKMFKKPACLLMVIIFIIPLAGCWNYQGLNQMSIVSGVAIDRNEENGDLSVTFEVINASGKTAEGSVKTFLIQSEGKTFFDTIRNARNMLTNRLYFGNMMVIIISEKIVRNEDIAVHLDLVMRDEECRETVKVVISQEATARELLETEGADSLIISNEIENIVEGSHQVTASTVAVQLYEAYNILQNKVRSLVLPVFEITNNIGGKNLVKLNGIGVFSGERIVGSLPADEAKNYLFITDDIKGGLLFLSTDDDAVADVTFQILKNKTGLSYTVQDGKIKFYVKTDTKVFLSETVVPFSLLDKTDIPEIEKRAQVTLKDSIIKTVKRVQEEYGSDIFGFGEEIYRTDYKLWEQICNNWTQLFKDLEVKVECKIKIINTSTRWKTGK